MSGITLAAMAGSHHGAAQPGGANAAAQDQRSVQDTCLGRADSDAAHMVEACSAVLAGGTATALERAAAHRIRGQAYARLKDEPRARADLVKSIELYNGAIVGDAGRLQAYAEGGAAFQSLDQADRALADYDEALRLHPDDVAALIGRGVLHANYKADLGKAIGDFDAALRVQPDNVLALMQRADAHTRRGEDGRALADLDRAIALSPGNAQAYFFRGLVYAGRAQLARAIADYSKALSIDPTHVQALISRAALYSGSVNNDQAIRDLDAAIALAPDLAVAYYNRGYARFAARDYQKAVVDYGEAIRLQPDMSAAYTNRCLMRAIIGSDLPLALADCNHALQLAPGSLDAHETRGFIHLRMGDPDTALAEYNIALKASPDRALALYGKGLAQIRKGRKAEGEASKAAARAIYPAVEREFSTYGLK